MIGFVWIRDTIAWLGSLVWLFCPAWDAVEFTLEVGFIYPFVVIDPTGKGATAVVAPGQMLDEFLPIPDEVSVPLYRLVLKASLPVRTATAVSAASAARIHAG